MLSEEQIAHSQKNIDEMLSDCDAAIQRLLLKTVNDQEMSDDVNQLYGTNLILAKALGSVSDREPDAYQWRMRMFVDGSWLPWREWQPGRADTARNGLVEVQERPLFAPVIPSPEVPDGLDVDALANEIRCVDGNHSLGAGALAEALMPFLLSTRPLGLGSSQASPTASGEKDGV